LRGRDLCRDRPASTDLLKFNLRCRSNLLLWHRAARVEVDASACCPARDHASSWTRGTDSYPDRTQSLCGIGRPARFGHYLKNADRDGLAQAHHHEPGDPAHFYSSSMLHLIVTGRCQEPSSLSNLVPAPNALTLAHQSAVASSSCGSILRQGSHLALLMGLRCRRHWMPTWLLRTPQQDPSPSAKTGLLPLASKSWDEFGREKRSSPDYTFCACTFGKQNSDSGGPSGALLLI